MCVKGDRKKTKQNNTLCVQKHKKFNKTKASDILLHKEATEKDIKDIKEENKTEQKKTKEKQQVTKINKKFVQG